MIHSFPSKSNFLNSSPTSNLDALIPRVYQSSVNYCFEISLYFLPKKNIIAYSQSGIIALILSSSPRSFVSFYDFQIEILLIHFSKSSKLILSSPLLAERIVFSICHMKAGICCYFRNLKSSTGEIRPVDLVSIA